MGWFRDMFIGDPAGELQFEEQEVVYGDGGTPLRYADSLVEPATNTRIKVAKRPTPQGLTTIPTQTAHGSDDDAALTASAQKIGPSAKNPRGVGPSAQPWQRDALEAPSSNETIAFAASTVESMARHIRFNVEKRDKKGRWEETSDYAEALIALRDDTLSQENLIGQTVRHIFLAGETYMGIYEGTLPHIVPYSPVEVTGQSVRRTSILGERYDANSMTAQTIGRDSETPSYLIRAWIPDDVDGKRAFSNMRAAASALNELRLIDDLSAALLVSRISGAGILLVPDETAFEDSTDDTASYISKALTDVASIAIAEPSLPEAHVPIVITAPSDLIDRWRLLELSTDTDEKLLSLRESANRRVERAVDLPELLFQPETGTHWSLATSLEMASNYFVARAAQRVAAALTIGLLLPVLKDGEIGEYRIGVVLTGLVSRTRAVADALQLHDRGLISDDTVREITGFDGSDKPTKEEHALRQLGKLAMSQPGTFGVQFLKLLGLTVDPPPEWVDGTNGTTGAGRSPTGQNPDGSNRPVSGDGPGQQTIDKINNTP